METADGGPRAWEFLSIGKLSEGGVDQNQFKKWDFRNRTNTRVKLLELGEHRDTDVHKIIFLPEIISLPKI